MLGRAVSDVYVRPIRARYQDPVDVVWFATAKRLGLRIRRNPAIFSMTDGSGLLELGPRETLDPDDSAAQMILHEVCHWITNGHDTRYERDWGFALDAELDWREHSCLRLQAALADAVGLRTIFAPTSQFRAYFDCIPADPFGAVEGWPHEELVVPLARVAYERAQGEPWSAPLTAAFGATAQIVAALQAFLPEYATDIEGDTLPSLWSCRSIV